MYINNSKTCPVNLDEFYHRLPSKRSIKKLLTDFLNSYPQFISEVYQSVKTGNAQEIRASAHTMKGVLSNLSISRAAGLALDLEQNAGNISRDNAIEVIAEINSELEKLRDFIESNPIELKE